MRPTLADYIAMLVVCVYLFGCRHLPEILQKYMCISKFIYTCLTFWPLFSDPHQYNFKTLNAAVKVVERSKLKAEIKAG